MARTKVSWKVALWCGPLLLLGVQLAPSPRPFNPPIVPAATIQAKMDVPPAIARLLGRSCMDCHSNATRWPWYSHIAPGSWVVASDVFHARRAMNFSEWQPETGLGLLAAACADVESGRMPKPRYLLLHPAARLSAGEKRQFCEWTHTEIQSVLRARIAARRAVMQADSTRPSTSLATGSGKLPTP